MGKYRPSEDSDLSDCDLHRSFKRQTKSKSTDKKGFTPVKTSKKKSRNPPVRNPNKNLSTSAKPLRSSEPFRASDSGSNSSHEEVVSKESKIQNVRGKGAEKKQNRMSDTRQDESYRQKSPAKKAVKTTANTRSNVQDHPESESGYAEEQNSSDRSTDEKVGRGVYQDAYENTSESSDSVLEQQDDTELEAARAKNVSTSLPLDNQVEEMEAEQIDLLASARGESSGRSIVSEDDVASDIRASVERSERQISPAVAARLTPEIILADASVNTVADFSAEQVSGIPADPPDAPRDNQEDTSDRNTLGFWLDMLKNEGPNAERTTSIALDLWAKDIAIRREQANIDLVRRKCEKEEEKVLYVRQKRLRLSRANT